jgi:hypothetical protein
MATRISQRSSLLLTSVSVMVGLSILLHGFSANPLIARYGAYAQQREPDHPLLQAVEVPATRRTFGSLPNADGPHAA